MRLFDHNMMDRSAGLSALADPTRRELIDLLAKEGAMTATALAERFDITRQAVSKHLNQLESAGMVTSRRSGRSVLYIVNLKEVEATSAWLVKTTANWSKWLDRLERKLSK